MRIVILHQPFPMGNYHISNAFGKHLTDRGHEVYLLEQLNGDKGIDNEYLEIINSVSPDVIYYEMLDRNTFEVVSKINCKKVLTVASKGVLNDVYDIINYKNKWFTHIFTNSLSLYDLLIKNNIPSNHFEYYWNPNNKDILQHYDYDCVFLGQGYHRLYIPECELDRNTFFNFNSGYDFNYAIYGLGWPNIPAYKGILPKDHNHSLYVGAKSALSIIEPDQRIYGMINNRYTEIAQANTPIITMPYNDVDWFGLDKYLNFVTNYNEFNTVVKQCINKNDDIMKKVEGANLFFKQQDINYLDKLSYIIEND